jgi:polyphosphate kinase
MNTTHAKYINRELSWLEFNQRVLDEASDVSNPLLERLKFLAITASNLDEFFMVRVGGLQLRVARGERGSEPAGLSASEQLDAIASRARLMVSNQYEAFLTDLEPALAENGFRRVTSVQLTEQQLAAVGRLFDTEIDPVHTPMAVSDDEFPLLGNHTLNLLVRLEAVTVDDEPRFAIIPLRSPRRFLTLTGESNYTFILLEDVVTLFVERYFPGEVIREVAPFCITRNADMSVREDLVDLAVGMEEVLDARKQSACVRLQVGDQISDAALDFLRSRLAVREDAIYRLPGPLNLSAFIQLTDMHGFESLQNDPWKPQQSQQVDMTLSMFDVLSEKDVLLLHPYESFDPVVKLIEEAAQDPDVLAIKQILYRTSRTSPVVAALKHAAQEGKNVTVIVELKARFDEERNIQWAHSLEQAGVQVIYGVKGLKTHAKVCIVVRREPGGIQKYLHFGTGNYNESTARLYSDVSYLTCDESLGRDATAFINAISGYSQPQKFRKLEMAPIGLRNRLLEMIEAETQHAKQDLPAQISIKLNSLVDPLIIDSLYKASQAGVRIRINVRGICCLKPGVPDLSENITAVSIVDRFLEHARILHFHHGGDDRVFISSADWMPRNLDRRVELLVPIEDAASKRRLMDVLDVYFQDTAKGRRLRPDGGYDEPTGTGMGAQEFLHRQTCELVQQSTQSRRLAFQPHRASGQDD